MSKRSVVRSEDAALRLQAAAPRRRRPACRSRRDGDDETAAIEVEIRNLTHAVRAWIRPGADALEIAGILREIVFDRLHLLWRVQRGDYPDGRRIPAPTLRAWIVAGPGSPATDARAADLEAGLGDTKDVLAAVLALCRIVPGVSELEAARRLWGGYRFSSVIRAHRRELAALTQRRRVPELDDR